ncbi:3-dehydroquinate synthase [Cytobacillus kochii]|uniref:3-dehydroquinate synthase n=1 Tax=Cytobacillus kochii TaxID=859143 RepID=UPI001CD34D1D|nr:3-dehydroquinate synthase [Cytobacillus kochii]MCA1028622.1 3-dehydroquinate synthase [Cytobacillus kochii]
MFKINIQTIYKNYPFYLGHGITENFHSILSENNIDKSGRAILIITDDVVAPLYLVKLKKILQTTEDKVYIKVLRSGETSKSLSNYQEIINFCIEHRLDRNSLLIGLGGGVIGDITGFVASTYMRGIEFLLIPTTILSHDSCIGGKNGLNFGKSKNICGTIYQPELIIFDTKYIETLSKRQLLSGMVEIILHGVIKDPIFLQWLDDNQKKLMSKDQKTMQEAIKISAEIKADIIRQDTLEHGKRNLLNFGHTFGHALESITDFKQYTHGEAVGVGMLLATLYSYFSGFCSFDLYIKLRNLLNKFEVPITIDKKINSLDILNSMYLDKKIKKNKLRLILIRNIGEVFIKDDIKEEHILKAMDYLRE